MTNEDIKIPDLIKASSKYSPASKRECHGTYQFTKEERESIPQINEDMRPQREVAIKENVSETSNILILQISPFNFVDANETLKIQRKFNIPTKTKYRICGKLYRVQAIVFHIVDTADTGHYVTNIFDGEKILLVNDENIT